MLEPNGDEVRSVCDLAGDMVVCLGYCERGPTRRRTRALQRGRVPVRRRHPRPAPQGPPAGRGGVAVHAPATASTRSTPRSGASGMLIDHDKTFPEAAARAGGRRRGDPRLPLGLADRSPTAPRAWRRTARRACSTSTTSRAPPRTRSCWLSANQSGRNGALHFLGQAKVVGPGGDILARTWSKGGLAVAEVDLPGRWSARPRAVLHHLAERRPETYRVTPACGSPC